MGYEKAGLSRAVQETFQETFHFTPFQTTRRTTDEQVPHIKVRAREPPATAIPTNKVRYADPLFGFFVGTAAYYAHEQRVRPEGQTLWDLVKRRYSKEEKL